MSKRITATDRIERALRAAPAGLGTNDLRRAAGGRAEDFIAALKSLRASGHVKVFPEDRPTRDGRVRGVLVHRWAPERSEPGSREFQPGSRNANQAAEAAWATEAGSPAAAPVCPACGSTGAGFCATCAMPRGDRP